MARTPTPSLTLVQDRRYKPEQMAREREQLWNRTNARIHRVANSFSIRMEDKVMVMGKGKQRVEMAMGMATGTQAGMERGMERGMEGTESGNV